MRGFSIGLAALLLAACDSGNVPPPGQEPLRPSTVEIAADEVLLSADGLTAGSEAFYFAAGQREVESALSRTLGKRGETEELAECGAGSIVASTFPGGLTVNFQDGALVGWLWREDAENIGFEGDLSVGSARGDIEALGGFSMIEDSTLGDEFALGDRIGGLFEDGSVAMLYAGTQCFFR